MNVSTRAIQQFPQSSSPVHIKTAQHCSAVPADWPSPSPEESGEAVEVALQALYLQGGRPAHQRLAHYYDRETKNAGASFVDLYPNEPTDITATDLLATQLLQVTFNASDVRRLIEPSPDRLAVLDALSVLPEKDLAEADVKTLLAMERFYLAVKGAVRDRWASRSNRWVLASKLCARKRPDLFPVRDRRVCNLLDLTRHNDFRFDWVAFRSLIQNHAVNEAIDALVGAVPTVTDHADSRLDTCRLRLLDVALWTYAREKV